ncbi:hypothetical protein [Psychrobacillus sp. FSL H8-0510]|uniref:hypothetical protein n=1 Tax=Psychrobacillus sp. FSL H8-0510 TaxID=2921394 RepID=UPI0030F88178
MENYKLLSLDIWDTVLRRKCHPDEIKLHTSKYIYLKYSRYLSEEYNDINALLSERRKAEGYVGQQKKANGFDDEYSLNEVFYHLINTVISTDIDISIEELVNELIEVELEQEMHVTYLDDNIIELIKKYSYDKLAYISDFYSSSNFIDKLLEKNGFPLKFDYKIVSSEVGLNKRSGNLFLDTQKKLNISAEKQLHIGDNPHSDYKVPNQFGIQALEYINNTELLKKRAIDKAFWLREQNQISYFDPSIKEKIAIKEDKLKKYGEDTSLFFFTYILNIIEECIKQKIDKVYYFTREGEFFAKIHREIEKSNPFGVPIPQAEILEVSRIATFAPSLSEISLDEMMRVWNMYSSQSMRAFFSTLNVELNEFDGLMNEYSIELDEVIQYPWLDERIQALFNDLNFKNRINFIIEHRRENLLKYLTTKGISEDTGKIAIVDIGWRGTIQDNLAYLLPRKEIFGYYLGLFDFINVQPINVKKQSFVSKDAKKYLKHVAPLEMICNSPNGSVVNYEFNDGKISAIKNIDIAENEIYTKYIYYFQEGVISKVKYLSEEVRNHALISSDLRDLAYQVLGNIIANPKKELTHAFFNLSHNETFGVGSFVDKRINFPVGLFIKALVSKNGKKSFLDFLENTTWPQGFLVENNLHVIKGLYNDRERRLTAN